MNTGIQLLIRHLENQFRIKVKIKELNDYMHFLDNGTIQTSITRSHSFTNHLLYKRLVFLTRSVIYFLRCAQLFNHGPPYNDEGGSQSGGFTRNSILTNEPE